MSDSLSDCRPFRTFNVMDYNNREDLMIEVDTSMPSLRVVRALERVIEWRVKPAALRLDNAPESISRTLVNWADEKQITLLYIQPGNYQMYLNLLLYNYGFKWGKVHSALTALNTF